MLDCAVPYLWEDVRAEPLFALLLGAHSERHEFAGESESVSYCNDC